MGGDWGGDGVSPSGLMEANRDQGPRPCSRKGGRGGWTYTTTATRYTMMAAAIETCRTNGMFLRNHQIQGDFTVISSFRIHVCGRHGLWSSLSNPEGDDRQTGDLYITVRYSTVLLRHE